MSSIGQVLELFVSKEKETTRSQRAVIELDENGVLEDKFYAKSLERSVLLTSIDSYELALNNGIEMSHGLLGENILIDYNPYNLPIGTKLKVGEVTLEVTQSCTICNHLSTIDETLPVLLKDDRGVFVKVIESGFIKTGEKLHLL